MTFGPLQLVVVTFAEAALPFGVLNRLRELRARGTVRLVDATYVSKDDQGELNELRVSDLSQDEAELLGVLSGALFGFGMAGTAGLVAGMDVGFLAAERGEFGITPANIDELADMIPRGRSVVLLLIEHLWAIDLKEAIQDANGAVLAHGWITPSTLIAIGAESADQGS